MSPRRNRSAWPWPSDSPVERAQRVAQMYRHVLGEQAPQACADVDQQMRAFGQTWVVTAVDTYDENDLLDTDLAAEYLHVQPRTVDEYARRGMPVVRTPDGVRYRVGDLRDWKRQRRQRRRPS